MPTFQPQTADPGPDAGVFWYHFRRELTIGFFAVLLLAAAWAGYRLYSNHRGDLAADELAGAKNVADFQKIIAEYGNTPAAASASLLLAEKQRVEGKFDEANKTLQGFIDKDPAHELVPAAKIAMAANLQSQSKTDEALSLYKQIAATYPKSFAAPLALISQVPLLKEKNQPDVARRVCETVLSQYGQSFWAGEAMREIRTLKPEAMPAISSAPAGGAAAPQAGAGAVPGVSASVPQQKP